MTSNAQPVLNPPASSAAASTAAGTSAAGLSGLVIACLGATWFIWGSTYLAIKWALVSFPAFFQMGSRFVVAGLLLGAWAWWRGAAWPTRSQWASAAVLGLLMLGGGYGPQHLRLKLSAQVWW